MPKRQLSSPAVADDYDSDVPTSKRAKNNKSAKNSSAVASKPGKGAKSGKGNDGEPFWELSSTRRIGLSEFKGKVMVNIREYYEKDGETLPGKKGISLPIDQFNALLSHLPQVESALAEKGKRVGRPVYIGAGTAIDEEVEGGEDDEEDDEKEDEDEDEKPAKAGKSKKRKVEEDEEEGE